MKLFNHQTEKFFYLILNFLAWC